MFSGILVRRIGPAITKTFARNVQNANVKPLANVKPELYLTDKCVERLKKLAQNDACFLRVTVEGGGCSGFQYKFDLVSKMNEDDK